MRCLTLFICILMVSCAWETACAWPLRSRPFSTATESRPDLEMARSRPRYRYNEELDKPRDLNRDETVGFGSLLQPFMPVIRREGRRRTRWVDPPPQ
jgi:hypothetical protein